MKRVLLPASVALLTACAGGNEVPAWQVRAHAALTKFEQHYLEGNVRQAQRDFDDARSALGATGDRQLVARAELMRCALGTAALDLAACEAFDAAADDASVADRAYGDFVRARLRAQDAALLPARYRAVAEARDTATRERSLRQIADPVSRLVAAGALFRAGQLSPAGLDIATDTASAQGYRRPLLAYLNVQARRAEASGDAAALRSIRSRIDLVLRSAPK